MRYVVFHPCPTLATVVRCYWVMECTHTGRAEGAESVSPDGCIEWIIHFRDRFSAMQPDGTLQLQPRSVVAGQITRCLQLQPAGTIGMVGVRFQPAGAARFVRHPIREWTDRILSMKDLLGADSVELETRILDAPGDSDRIQLLERFLLRQFDAMEDSTQSIRRAVAMIDEYQGQLPVDSLARCAGLGLRQFERRFTDTVGIGPKLLCRVMRFRRLLKRLQQGRSSSWTERAAACGYYDQSHLIRDFRAFTGRSPQAYLATLHPIERCLIRSERS